jgi:hypothetical protein
LFESHIHKSWFHKEPIKAYLFLKEKEHFFSLSVLRRASLRNEQPKDFRQLLNDVGFSHNTLRMHLASLEERDFSV